MKHFSVLGFARLLAWLAIIMIAYATLTNVGFVYSLYYRIAPSLSWPGIKTYARAEHVIAFAVFGALFSFAYPRRTVFCCIVVFCTAILLEYLQTLTPDRHGTVTDAIEKLVGGAIGIFATTAATYYWPGKRLAKGQRRLPSPDRLT